MLMLKKDTECHGLGFQLNTFGMDLNDILRRRVNLFHHLFSDM